MSQSVVCFVCSSALQVWELDPLNRKLKPTECQTGFLKRVVKCVEVRRRGSSSHSCAVSGGCSNAAVATSIPAQISEDDQFLFCGTTSGDIMKFSLKTRLLSDYGPRRFSAKHSRVGPPTHAIAALLCSDLLISSLNVSFLSLWWMGVLML